MSDFPHILGYLSIIWFDLVCMSNPNLHNYNAFLTEIV